MVAGKGGGGDKWPLRGKMRKGERKKGENCIKNGLKGLKNQSQRGGMGMGMAISLGSMNDRNAQYIVYTLG